MGEEIGQTDEHGEVFVLRPDDAQDETAAAAPARKPQKSSKFADTIEKAENFAKKPIVWIFSSFLLITALFGLLRAIVGDSNETVYRAPPLLVDHAIAASMSDREIISLERSFSTLEKQLSKAALLYDQGSTEQALDIYEQISLFSETLSLYNLGVAQMHNGEYERAIRSFDEQIAKNELRTPGAINAAVCALKLGDEPMFRHYITVAKSHLSNEASSPLFGYYYTLVNYYDNRPFNAVIAADMPTIDFARPSQELISAKMKLMFDDTKGAISLLEKQNNPENLLTLGLLYARSGEWSNATDRLTRAMAENIDVNRSRSALILVHLKNGFYLEAASLINAAIAAGDDPLVYPIRVKLKDRLFDVNQAQDYFAQDLLVDMNAFFQVMFNFAPYIMIDPSSAVLEIRKGQMALTDGDIADAEEFLTRGKEFSSAGARMSAAVKLALSNRIVQANQAFAEVEKDMRSSAVLEYNLALSYAQLGQFHNAHTHFRRAYFLNKKNLNAGVYAAILAPLAGEKDERLMRELLAVLNSGEDEESAFLRAMLSFNDRNFQATAQWLERKAGKIAPQYILLDLFAADQTGRDEDLKIAARKLSQLYPDDMLTAIFAFYAENKGKPMKQFAFEAQKLMARRDLNFDTLYYGTPIVRELYVHLGLISGNLQNVRDLLQKRLAIEKREPRTLMQAMILTNIYLQNFEEAYTLSNALIDEFGIQSARTLFFCAIAAIGAGHKENAIALLQLAKNVAPQYVEPRFALGLLYQEIGDAKGAALEYSLTGDERHESRYFDFEIRLADDPERR